MTPCAVTGDLAKSFYGVTVESSEKILDGAVRLK